MQGEFQKLIRKDSRLPGVSPVKFGKILRQKIRPDQIKAYTERPERIQKIYNALLNPVLRELKNQ